MLLYALNSTQVFLFHARSVWGPLTGPTRSLMEGSNAPRGYPTQAGFLSRHSSSTAARSGPSRSTGVKGAPPNPNHTSSIGLGPS